MTLRQGLGTGISVIGVLALTRTLGPAAYGHYAAAMGIFVPVQLLAQLGLNVFLVRRTETPDVAIYRQASVLLFGVGLLCALAGAALAPALEAWTRLDGVAPLIVAAFALLPLANLSVAPLARLERALAYHRVAQIELAGQVLFFVAAVPLAFAGWGAWAPLAGFWAQQLFNCAAYHIVARYAPGWHMNAALTREMVRYGVGISASHWIWHLRRLANPMIVGRYLGAEMVAVVAVAAQISTYLGFVLTGTYRVSTAAFSRVQHDSVRLRTALRDGITVQVIGVAACLALFALTADQVVPRLLGPEWGALIQIYPWIAASFLIMSVFSLHSSVLHVLGRNVEVAAYLLVHVLLLFAAAFVLVPRFGLIGFGLAEIAATGAYVLADLYVRRALDTTWYGKAPLVCAATLPLLFFPLLSWPALVVSGGALLWLRPWTEVGKVLRGRRGGYAYER